MAKGKANKDRPPFALEPTAEPRREALTSGRLVSNRPSVASFQPRGYKRIIARCVSIRPPAHSGTLQFLNEVR